MDSVKGKLFIKQIAEKNQVTVEEVRKEMEFAIKEARKNPETQQRWKELFGEAGEPTPEKLISIISKEVKKKNNT